MAVLWVESISFDDSVKQNYRPTTQQTLPFLSECCHAPLAPHWPCDEKAKCTQCGECALCGSNFEAQAIEEIERKHDWRKR